MNEDNTAFETPNEELSEDIFNSNKSFCEFGSPKNGFMEIDLVSFVKRGEETRYLSILIDGFIVPEGTSTPAQSYASMSIKDEKQFNKFKEFVQKLQWR